MRSFLLLLLLGLGLSAMDDILVLRPVGTAFEQAEAGFLEELGDDVHLTTFILGHENERARLTALVDRLQPRALLTLDNTGLTASDGLTVHGHLIPRVATMAIQLDAQHLPPATCGIAYDVPGFALLTRFRAITGLNPQEVLVIHRPTIHGTLVSRARDQLAEEGIHLRILDATQDGNRPEDVATFLRRHLASEVAQAGTDAVWILNDPWQLDPETLRQVWLPVAQRSGKPFLAGIPTFVDPRLGFALFAAAPDPRTLGIQAGQQTRDILAGRPPGTLGLEPMLGIQAILDGERARILGIVPREAVEIRNR